MTDVSTNPPSLEGAKDASKAEEEKMDKDVVLNQALHMDLPLENPPDAVPLQKDYVDVAPQEQVVELAKEGNEERTNVKTNATVKRARTARKKIKEVQSLEGTAGAQGAPIPDYWTSYLEMQRDYNNQFLEALKDLKHTAPAVAPLQDQMIVEPSLKIQTIEDPVRPNDMLELAQKSTPAVIPIPQGPPSIGIKRARPPPDIEEEESYERRFHKAFNAQFNLLNTAAQKRAANDPSMGQRQYETNTKDIYF